MSLPDGELPATVTATAGEVLLDDGRRLAYDPAVLSPQVRLLHPGQRVRLRVQGGVVAALTLAGLPLPAAPPRP